MPSIPLHLDLCTYCHRIKRRLEAATTVPEAQPDLCRLAAAAQRLEVRRVVSAAVRGP